MRKFLAILFCTTLMSCASTNVDQNADQTVYQLDQVDAPTNMMVDKKYEGYEVKIEFFLNDNAEVVEYKVTSESGLLELDNAGIDAIKKSSPFTAIKVLPLEVFNEFKHVKLTIIPTFD